MKYLFLLLLFTSVHTTCDELKLIYGIDPILHFDRSTDLNENIHLFGIKYNKWSLYSFINSYNKDSILLTKEVWDRDLYHLGKFSIRASSHFGIVHGYKDTNMNTIVGLMPWLYISGDFDYKLSKNLTIGINLSVVPAFDSSVFSKSLTITRRF